MNDCTNKGYYVLAYGGGRYTSVAFYATKAEAERCAAGLDWRGMPNKIQDVAEHYASLYKPVRASQK